MNKPLKIQNFAKVIVTKNKLYKKTYGKLDKQFLHSRFFLDVQSWS